MYISLKISISRETVDFAVFNPSGMGPDCRRDRRLQAR